MVPTISYKQMEDRVRRYWHRMPLDGEAKAARLVAMLFARPSRPVVQEEIVPSLGYYYHRSGAFVDVFCAGYSQYGSNMPDGTMVRDPRPPDGAWYYSDRAFNDFRAAVEEASQWRYGGGTELVLLNTRRRQSRNYGILDYQSAVVIDLEKITRDGAIPSVSSLFEHIFRYSEQPLLTDPAAGCSDALGLRCGKSSLTAILLALVPEPLRQCAMDAAYQFAEEHGFQPRFTETLEDIEALDFGALERALGPIDTLCFLGIFAPPGRDSSESRHEWVDSLTGEGIDRMIEELRAEGKMTRQRLEAEPANGRSQSGHEDV